MVCYVSIENMRQYFRPKLILLIDLSFSDFSRHFGSIRSRNQLYTEDLRHAIATKSLVNHYLDPLRVTLLRGHFNWICVAYPRFVSLYRLVHSINNVMLSHECINYVGQFANKITRVIKFWQNKRKSPTWNDRNIYFSLSEYLSETSETI